MNFEKKISIIGAGSWGTSLAIYLANIGYKVCLWCYESELAEQINKARENKIYFPGIYLPEAIWATSDPKEAMEFADFIVECVPSMYLEETLNRFVPFYNMEKILIVTTKGMDSANNRFAVDSICELFLNHGFDIANKIVLLSGPNFAKDMVINDFSGTVLASKNDEILAVVKKVIQSDFLCVDMTHDVVGVQICSVFKNIIALTFGICRGAGFSDNFCSFVLSRGIGEMVQIVQKAGGEAGTVNGLAGFGDIFLTTASKNSRNTSFGASLGAGADLARLKKEVICLPEGVCSIRAALSYAESLGVKTPIFASVCEFIFNKVPVGKLRENILKSCCS